MGLLALRTIPLDNSVWHTLIAARLGGWATKRNGRVGIVARISVLLVEEVILGLWWLLRFRFRQNSLGSSLRVLDTGQHLLQAINDERYVIVFLCSWSRVSLILRNDIISQEYKSVTRNIPSDHRTSSIVPFLSTPARRSQV